MNRGWLVFAVFALGHWFSFFFRTAPAVIADDLSRDLSLSPNELGLTSSLFFLTFAAAQLPLGLALDRFGGRRVTAAVMSVAVVGAFVFAAAPSFVPLALGRALLGLGTAASLMGGLKALSGWFGAKRFATMAGALVAVGSTGALMAAGPLAWLNQLAGWRSIFVVGGAAFLMSALVILLLGRDGPALAKPRSEQTGEQSSGFGLIFRNRTFWRLAVLGLAVSGSLVAHQTLWAGPYLTDGVGLEPLAAGGILSALAVGVIVGFLVSGWLADRLGLARVMVTATVLLVLVQVALGAVPSNPLTLTALFAGFGFLASFSILLLAQARTIFPLELTGRAITAVNLFFFGGGFLLQWGLGVMIERFPVEAGGGFPPVAYGTGFWVTGGLCLVALLGYWPLSRQRARGLEGQQ